MMRFKGIKGGDGEHVLSCTAFHRAVVCSLDRDIMRWALPLRMKSACGFPLPRGTTVSERMWCANRGLVYCHQQTQSWAISFPSWWTW